MVESLRTGSCRPGRSRPAACRLSPETGEAGVSAPSPAEGPPSLEAASCSVEGFSPPGGGEAPVPTPGRAAFFTPSRLPRGISRGHALPGTAGMTLGWTPGQPTGQSRSPLNQHATPHVSEAAGRRRGPCRADSARAGGAGRGAVSSARRGGGGPGREAACPAAGAPLRPARVPTWRPLFNPSTSRRVAIRCHFGNRSL